MSTSLHDRLLALLGDRARLAERRMFGARCVMLDERLLVCVRKEGGLLVRVDPDDGEDLLARPGARQAVMGERSMGPAWIDVDGAVLEDDEALGSWLAAALAQHERARGAEGGG